MRAIPQHILEANESLTRALEALYNAPAHVTILSETTRPSTPDEHADGYTLGTTLWERQIALYIGETLVLYALTRVPSDGISQFTPPLDQLGHRPLGYWLFHQPSRVRAQFKLSTLRDTQLPMECLDPCIQALPAHTLTRESLHLVQDIPISIVEFIP